MLTHTTSQAGERTRIALFAQTKDESDYNGGRDFTVDLSICCVPNNGECYPRGMSDTGLEGLHIILRGGTFMHKLTEGKTAWHSDVSIVYCDVQFAEVRRVEEMAKTIKAVHRKLDAMRERMGYATSAFDLLGRFADAVGAKAFFFRNDAEAQSISGEKFRQVSIADGLSKVRDEANRMERTLNPVAIAA